MATFGERLYEATKEHGRLCVGIDPHAALLEQWGLSTDVRGLREFSQRCVEAFAGRCALVKPQVAFYEAFGSQGFAVLEETIAALREAGTLVLADAKRGDIGSTMQGYATAWLDPASPLCSDAVTVSPYLGFGSLAPLLQKANAHDAGVFVLAATSNPEARELQDQRDEHGLSIAQQIVNAVREENAAQHPGRDFGNCGVVVGATLERAPEMTQLRGPVLLPGVGAQGAGARDVARLAAGNEALAIPNVSRAVLKQGPDVDALSSALRTAAQDYPGIARP
ncbi:orotidine-5'-phosphate decarboxylase [Corynebacterium gerontici]|uniref:Orotidine 5'-phosphate decarboxylase n=1 Tax=Corynebacterium gerontici TaxID=2079234 RepID=A0A3G6J0N0_9CORY|nr:orotidine-5'-phosphate decarboxylase [Corynebacterium gerontici]AZA11509.1 orotidine 5'-phosphate decarboxylase [Corynebacterium gerontici]